MANYSLASRSTLAGVPSTIKSSIADECHTCPICFVLMKPPHSAPIILSPCGHTFCAKCVAVHTAVQRKKARMEGLRMSAPPCPHCKQKILSQTVNIPLQNMINQMLTVQKIARQAELEKIYPKTPLRGQELYDDLLQPRTPDYRAGRDGLALQENVMPGQLRCQTLQDALLETRHTQHRLEEDLAATAQVLQHLNCKQKDVKEMLQKISMEHRMVQSELEDIADKKIMLHRAHSETLAKAKLIEGSLVALEKSTETIVTHQPPLMKQLPYHSQDIEEREKSKSLGPKGDCGIHSAYLWSRT